MLLIIGGGADGTERGGEEKAYGKNGNERQRVSALFAPKRHAAALPLFV